MAPLQWNEWLVVGTIVVTIVALLYFERRYRWKPEITRVTPYAQSKDGADTQPLSSPKKLPIVVSFDASRLLEDQDIASYGVGGANYTPESTQIPPDTIKRRR